MAKFLFVYRSQPNPNEAPPSPEQIQAIMAAWGAWFQKMGAAVLDGGDGLQPSGKIVHPDGKVSDGPFIEAKEVVGGYSVIQADTYEQAAEHAMGCPMLSYGGSVEIRELAGLQ